MRPLINPWQLEREHAAAYFWQPVGDPKATAPAAYFLAAKPITTGLQLRDDAGFRNEA
jgi:hypothetical protein